MKQKLIFIILLGTLGLLSNNSFGIEEDKGGKLSKFQVIQHTLSACISCLRCKVVGLCFWLCNAGIYSVETTPKVDHYLTDAVVSVLLLIKIQIRTLKNLMRSVILLLVF